MAAPTSPILDTHTLETDLPHALSSVERWTCTRCGCAVLVKGGHVYGSASVEECGNPAPAAVPVDTSPADPDAEVIERVARYMAAEDWLEDSVDGDWWDKCSPKFREDYRTSARRVIAIVRGGEQR